MSIEHFDFAIGWPERHDPNDAFIGALAHECKARRLRFLCVDETSLKKIIKEIKNGRIRIKFFLDMASETFDPNHPFTQLVYLLKDSGTRIVDDPDDVKSAADKSITHFDLLRSRVPVPYTIVIRKWEPSRRLTREERERLGSPFVIKPALGYGQKGVRIVGRRPHSKEIDEARLFDPGDNYLVQEFITPAEIYGRPAWFRVFQLFGEIIPCWWNPSRNEYGQVTLREIDDNRLMPLVRIASEIGRITRIDWFSCEIAINSKNRKFVVIDYVNDQCAIYPKSEHADGIPDDLINLLAQRLVEKAWLYTRGEFTLAYRAVWFPRIKVRDENA